MAYSLNLKDVKKLREITSVGVDKCIQALKENDGNLEKSLTWLNDYAKSLKKSSDFSVDDLKNSKFGLVSLKEEGNKIISFALKCESDFIYKNRESIIVPGQLGVEIA